MTNQQARDLPRRRVLGGSAAVLTVLAADGCGHTRPGTGTGRAAPAQASLVPNVRVSRDSFAVHGGPYLAANPADGRNLLGACSVYQGAQRSVATLASFDGGASWRNNGPLPIDLAGVTGNLTAGNATVAFDLRGRGFVCAVARNGQTRRGGIRLWRTDDGGLSFAAPVTAATGFLDHPGLAAGRSPAAPGNLYLAAAYFTTPSDGRLVFCRSTDAGRSFEPRRYLDPGTGTRGRLPVMAAGPHGTVCVMCFVAMPDGSNLVKVISSQDHGRTFAAPAQLTRVIPAPVVAGVTARSCPAIAADPASGHVYAAVAAYDAAAGRSQIQLFTSADQGRTWSPPAVLAASTPVTYMQPQLAVASDGHVGVSVFVLARGRVNVLLFVSGRLGRFGRPLQVTGQGFGPAYGPSNSAGEHWIGGCQGLAATPSRFHPFWNDTRTGRMEIFTATVPANLTHPLPEEETSGVPAAH
jgi:hypothetical protein